MGSSHPRGHGRGKAPTRCAPAEEGRMGPRIREDTGGGRRPQGAPLRKKAGWVPASARTREGEGAHKVRPCGRRPDGSPHPRGHGRGKAPTRCAPAEEGRMGPRIREDTGGGRRPQGTPLRKKAGWVLASARTRDGEGAHKVRPCGRRPDGSPHPRGHGRGKAPTRCALAEQGRMAFPHPRGHGRGKAPTRCAPAEEGRMGPRIREDTGGGRRPQGAPLRKKAGWVPASARTREGEGAHKVRPCGRRPDGSPHPRGHGRGKAPTRCAPAEEGRMGPRIREDTGGGRGSCMREDNGWGMGARRATTRVAPTGDGRGGMGMG